MNNNIMVQFNLLTSQYIICSSYESNVKDEKALAISRENTACNWKYTVALLTAVPSITCLLCENYPIVILYDLIRKQIFNASITAA